MWLICDTFIDIWSFSDKNIKWNTTEFDQKGVNIFYLSTRQIQKENQTKIMLVIDFRVF